MLKINYPTQKNDIDAMHKRYLDCFPDKAGMQRRLNPVLSRMGLKRDKRFTIENILIAPIEELLQICAVMKGKKWEKHLETIQRIFNYDKFANEKKYQPVIANFFMNTPELNTTTCYFCNIDHIYSFKLIDDFQNGLDLVTRGTAEDLVRIKGIGKAMAKKIKDQSKGISSLSDLKNIPAHLVTNIENLEVKERNNLFTLDHVLDKAANPVAALSLYNFVPCCYSCNSKFKRSQKLVNANPGISPTSKDFLFDKYVRFKLFYYRPEPAKTDKDDKKTSGNSGKQSKSKDKTSTGSDNKSIDINSVSDFVLNFEIDRDPVDYDNFLQIFRLRARYNFHKKEILELIRLKREYSDSQIDEIARLTNRTSLEIKKTIFGKEIFEDTPNTKPLTKLKRDIALEIKILNEM